MDHARIESGTFSSDGVDVEYLFKPAHGDRQHLIVLFSGFRKLGAVDYYGEAQRSLRANVLWIVDRFDDHFSYYLRAFGGVDITAPIHALIEERIRILGLTRSQVSLAGFSKGASAALYYALAFDYPRVVAAAPRYRIGSYVKTNWSSELGAMTGHSETLLHELDATFDRLAAQRANTGCSIVLLTSPADDRHLAEAAPLAGLLSSYENFVVVNTLSPQVTKHSEVTSYNVPLINALLIMAAEGVEWPGPPVGEDRLQDAAFDRAAGTPVPLIRNGLGALGSSLDPDRIMREQSERGILEAAATSVELTQEGTLYVEGHMLRRGTPIPSYGLFVPSLTLHDEHSDTKHHLALGALKNEGLSASQYQQVWVDYSHAGFASPKQSGFDLSHLPPGHYRVDARWKKDDVTLSAEGIPAPRHETWRLISDRWIGSVCDAGAWTLHSIDTAGRPASGSYTELTSMSTKASLVFPRGYFVPRGMDHPRWDSVRFALSAVPSEGSSSPVRSFTLANDNRSDASRRSGEPWRDQSKATYSTRRHAGLDVSSLSPGKYELRVSARRKDDVQSIKLPGTLLIDDGLPAKPLVGVIGSCVSRDFFSSRVYPGWKEDFAYHGAFYQSSLISFMAPALDVTDDVVGDLNQHDAAVTLEDMRKGYRDKVALNNPDILVLDMRADVRMGVIGVNGTWLTDNVWKIQNSEFYQSLDTRQRRSFSEDPESFLDLFRNSCKKFSEFMKVSAPNTRIVLNRARSVSRHRGFVHPGGSYNAEQQERMNKQWAQLDRIFVEEVGPDVIDPMFDGAASNSDHPWGPGPVHYEMEVYERFRTQLREIAGVQVTATWTPANDDAPGI
ncbi:DUF6270 domain-containing protein [Brachybacterium alimentarium]|uniref:DUF6270 domain-containing protein n=1 Tax=Brachybacterium alimentarium TaxID=47845 RepID=UPI003FCF612D